MGMMLHELSAADASSFIVTKDSSKKSKSKNALKEDVGTHIKHSLEDCASLSKAIGELQVELAAMQKNLYTKVEALIDNKKPFKKASKVELEESTRVLSHLSTELRAQVSSVHKLKAEINESACLKQEERTT